MSQTIFSVIHASRQRPTLAANTANRWISSSKNPNQIEYILSIDVDDPCQYEYFKNFQNLPVTIVSHLNRGSVEAINSAVKFTKGQILLVVSDDFDCFKDWDDQLIRALSGKQDFCVKTNDGLQPWIITLPILDRAYYNRFGYIYYPGYQHMFCDTEMTHVADLLDRKITIDLQFQHLHYVTGRTPRDFISLRNDSTWHQGEQLYLSRLQRDFDLKNFAGRLRCAPHHTLWLKSRGIYVQDT